MRPRFVAAGIAATFAGVILAGCGLGAGRGSSDVSLTITRDFGTHGLGAITARQLPGSETVMRMLERSFRVATRYGGGFVESINGQSGNSNRLDWFYYVNGIQGSVGAAQTPVHKGDRIWWDLHDWSAGESIPAVVGSFPEPFIHGSGGKRFPTVIECSADVSAACEKAASELRALGVPTASQAPGTGSGTDSISMLVGTWRDLRSSLAALVLREGPGASGVYAKFVGGGRSLQLLDPHSRSVRTLGRGTGLVAATAQSSAVPTWLITGTDPAGVAAAAAQLSAARLDHHFAVAVDGRTVLPVPLDGGS